MLTSLYIRDFILVRAIEIEFPAGFTALTGETGAGKSVVLSGLGVALGARPPAASIRDGAESAACAARFDLAPEHPVRRLLAERGVYLDPEEPLVFRRVMKRTGAARGYVNDQPVGAALLAEAGRRLVEMSGQFAALDLKDPAHVLALVDADPDVASQRRAVNEAWSRWRSLRARATALAAEATRCDARREALDLALADLDLVAPEAGELARVEAARAVLRTGEKLAESLAAARDQLVRGGVEAAIASAVRLLDRGVGAISVEASRSDGADGPRDLQAGGGLIERLRAAAEGLERALIEVVEARGEIDRAAASANASPDRLETVESRLFALRAAARRHGVPVDDLPALRARLAAERLGLDDEGRVCAEAATEAEAAFAVYIAAAEELSRRRRRAADDFVHRVSGELEPLKLARMALQIRMERTPGDAADAGGANGFDRLIFEARTRAGAAFAPVHTAASGGELARLSLAISLAAAAERRAEPGALEDSEFPPLAIFDEADIGVGGAVAAAIGERLARLGRSRQVIAVTHSPQVAAAADIQLKALRAGEGDGERADVERLGPGERREEIARMLAGASVTREARAAAARLLAGA
ncbi:DNA repair protein RecN [bacterium]|nr:DNA repair protein RecN [bacterium]